MAFVVGVLEAANGRSRRPNALGQFALRESGLGSKLEDLSCQIGVDNFLFVGLDPVGVVTDVTVVEKLDRGGLEFSLSVAEGAIPAGRRNV